MDRVLSFLSEGEIARENLISAYLHAVDKGQVEIMRYFIYEAKYIDEQPLKKSVIRAAASGNIKAVQLVEEAAPGSTERYRMDAFVSAAQEGHLDMLKYLVEGRDQNQEWNEEWNDWALYDAIENGHENIVRYLIGQGVNWRDLSPISPPLLIAASRGHEHLVKLFMDLGAPVSDYEKAIRGAANQGHEKVQNLLLEKGAEKGADLPLLASTALVEAVGRGDLNRVRELTPYLQGREEMGWIALETAMSRDQREIVAHFLDQAVENGWVNTARFMARSGAFSRSEIKRARHHAISQGKPQIAEALKPIQKELSGITKFKNWLRQP